MAGRSPSLRLLLSLSLLLALGACGDDGTTTDAGVESDAALDAETDAGPPPPPGDGADCDPLVPTHCAFPFPNDLFTVADESTPNGIRVAIPQAAMPDDGTSSVSENGPFNEMDGFSPGGALLVHMPGATSTGLADPSSIGTSLEADHPTVLLDLTTGERLPHWSELDVTYPVETQSLMVRPIAPLANGHRFVVAIRNIVDAEGNPLAPSPAFLALRDGGEYDHPSIAARRSKYEDEIFPALATAGVAREDLQLAWDFTVGSSEHITARMLHMRDEAFEMVGELGPNYEIVEVIDNPRENVARQIHGRIIVPSYIDRPDYRGALVFGDDGMPEVHEMASYDFWVVIPQGAVENPRGVMQYGHGLLGTGESVTNDGRIIDIMNEYGIVGFAMSLDGMAMPDAETIISTFQNGELHEFRRIPDRLHQGMINWLLCMKMMRGRFVTDENVMFEGVSAINPENAYYFGGSQGGIFGATYMALTDDVERGLLGVPGQSYSILLYRSVLFDIYRSFLDGSFEPLDAQYSLALIQMLWDRAEPTGYSRHIVNDRLPGTIPHQVMLLVSIGDHQVTTLGAHVMARAIGAPLVRSVARPVYGLEEVDSPHAGSGMIEFDFGLPPEPLENRPLREGDDPHGSIARLAVAREFVGRFFVDGVVDNVCDGVCDPE